VAVNVHRVSKLSRNKLVRKTGIICEEVRWHREVANRNLDMEDAGDYMREEEEGEALPEGWKHANKGQIPDPEEYEAEAVQPPVLLPHIAVAMKEERLQVEVQAREHHHGIEGVMLVADAESRQRIEGQ